jgi:mannose/fructose/N-acetylgalactosamine-specific phosphotransferase system component IIC
LDLIHLALLGGLLALDGTSVGQFMVSRPLVAGVLTGLLLGDPALGLLVGGIMEVYLISMFPVGGAQFPEGGPSALVGVAAAAGVAGPAGVALGTFLGLVWSQLAAVSIRFLRRANGRLAPDPSLPAVTAHRVVWGHLLGVALDFARGVLLTVLGVGAGALLARPFESGWPLGDAWTLGLLAAGASVPAGAFVASLGGWRRRKVVLGIGFVAAFLWSVLL